MSASSEGGCDGRGATSESKAVLSPGVQFLNTPPRRVEQVWRQFPGSATFQCLPVKSVGTKLEVRLGSHSAVSATSRSGREVACTGMLRTQFVQGPRARA